MNPKNRITLIAIISLAMLVVTIQPSLEQTQESGSVPLYLHTNYSQAGLSRRILNTAPPYGSQQSAYLFQELAFVLEPSLSLSTRISGAVTFNLWLVATSTIIGIVNATLVANLGLSNTTRICSLESPIVISTQIRSQPYSFAVGPVVQTLQKGSTLELRIVVRASQALVSLMWDTSQTPSSVVIPFAQQNYYSVRLYSVDMVGLTLASANLTITREDSTIWTGNTNIKGEAAALLPQSGSSRNYNISVSWKGRRVSEASNVELAEGTNLVLVCRVYDLTVTVRDMLGTPLADATVEVALDSSGSLSNRTALYGEAIFSQLPAGPATVTVNYQGKGLSRLGLDIQSSMRIVIPTGEVPGWSRYALVTSFLSVLALAVIFSERTLRAHRAGFGFLIQTLGGEIPKASTVMVSGNPGSGKTILMQKLLHTSLTNGQRCLFISNQEFPEKIMDNMSRLGLDVSSFYGKDLLFIDWYSGTAGRNSAERLSVSSLSDLTGVGTQISSGISSLGEKTLVFVDSINPLLATLTGEQVLRFIHAIGARVKGQGGTLLFSSGIDMDSGVLAGLESTSDCIIQLERGELETGLKRRLRVRKLSGQPHLEKWIEFSIERGEGIVFYTTKRSV
ncbi:MAG: ATPase domain-containing protein [archaeon]